VTSESSGDTKWLDYTTAIEEYLTEQGLLDKGIAPNVDFYSGSVYDSLGIPVDMYTPIFAMPPRRRLDRSHGRVPGGQPPHPPAGRYTGPKASEFVPVDDER